MRIYEELFIVDPDASEEEIDSLVGQVEAVVKNHPEAAFYEPESML